MSVPNLPSLLESLRVPSSSSGRLAAERAYESFASANPADLCSQLVGRLDPQNPENGRETRAFAAVLARTHVNKNAKDFMVSAWVTLGGRPWRRPLKGESLTP